MPSAFLFIFERHSILFTIIFFLYKLYHYGVWGPACDLFCDYLNDRTQLVSFNKVHSQNEFVCLPQRSILTH